VEHAPANQQGGHITPDYGQGGGDGVGPRPESSDQNSTGRGGLVRASGSPRGSVAGLPIADPLRSLPKWPIMKGVLVNPWLQTSLSLIAGLLAAGGALLGVRLSVQDTKTRQSGGGGPPVRRSADLALNNSSAKRVVGLKMLTKLAQSDLAQRNEYLLLDVFPKRVLDELLRHLSDLSSGRLAGPSVAVSPRNRSPLSHCDSRSMRSWAGRHPRWCSTLPRWPISGQLSREHQFAGLSVRAGDV
jgi:hypothetical protein